MRQPPQKAGSDLRAARITCFEKGCFLSTVLCLLLLAPVSPGARACGVPYYPSVHFNTDEPDFGAPPRPFNVGVWGEDDNRPTDEPNEIRKLWNWNWDAKEAAAHAHERRLATLLIEARRRERLGHYVDAARAYEKYLRGSWNNRASIRDRIEVLRQGRGKVERKLLELYLRARDFYDADKRVEARRLMQRLYADTKAGMLRVRALYALACLEYDERHFAHAADLFENLLREFPGSVNREEALIMAARCALCSPPQKDRFVWNDKPLPASAAVRRGRELLGELLKEYPASRFRANAVGWLGRCEYVQARYAEAMRFYLKQLAAATTRNERINAMSSIYFTRCRMTARDASRLATTLRAEPVLAVHYLDYRLNHSHRDKPAATDSLALLAESILRRHPHTPVTPVIYARLAEINYHCAAYRQCVRWATCALSARGRRSVDTRRDLAYYLRGSARHKLRNRRGAIADFETLLRRFPDSYLRSGARENLAILYEERGDLCKALEHYFVLGYDADLAFMLDARMTTRQIRRFLASHSHHRQRDLLVYSLGIRYLRVGDLTRAERALRLLPVKRLKAFYAVPTLAMDFQPICILHERPYNPLVAIRDLRASWRDIRRARTANARAAAMYALASYYYNKRDLLLYNMAIWNGRRSYYFCFCWNGRHATRKDESASRRHHYEHECLNHARRICLSVVKRYPHSPAAPKALYRAACCARKLSEFDYWWRDENKRHDFQAESVRLMKQVYRRYPKSTLARPAKKYAQAFKETG